MIIDLKAEMNKRALEPRYDVGVQTYHPGQISFELQGTTLRLANDALTQIPHEEKEIKADEIAFDRNGMEYFRHLLLTVTEAMKSRKDLVTKGIEPHFPAQSISAYLRPVFHMHSETGYDYWDALREIDSRPSPIPRDYLIFLPEAESRNPGRDDIIRALVPFKKAQREALQAGWNDSTSVIRIRHSGVSRPGLVIA